MGLVFPGQEHIADAPLHECGRGTAGAGVKDGHIFVELRHEFARLAFIAPVLPQGVGVGGEVIPTRAARGFRVWRDDGDAPLHEVAPILDAFRVPLADEEDDGRGVGRAVVRQALLPILRQQPRLLRDRIDIVGESERDDIGLEPVDDGARLLGGASVGLLDGHGLPGFLEPMLAEGFVEIAVKLPRGVVGDIQDGLVRGVERRGRCQRGKDREALEWLGVEFGFHVLSMCWLVFSPVLRSRIGTGW